MARASAAEWAKRVDRWDKSGMTAKAFAAKTGINASTLSYWKWKLANEAGRRTRRRPRRDAAQSAGAAALEQSRAQTPDRSPEFVELPVVELATSRAGLEVVVGQVLVRVPSDVDEVTLVRVLRAVGAVQ